jgi:hypothetical protein
LIYLLNYLFISKLKQNKFANWEFKFYFEVQPIIESNHNLEF